MICPTCKNDMIVVEYQSIELDYCNHCRGVWFDSGELELLMESMGLAGGEMSLENVLNMPEARSSEAKRRCPICGWRMKKSALGQAPKVLTDVCSHGDGIWFDGGELDQLLKQLAEKSQTPQGAEQHVVSFLKEVFKARD